MSAFIYVVLLVFCLMLCEAESCYESLLHYNGTVAITNGGRKCQRWDKQWPRRHGFYSSTDFPEDGSVTAAENYCRQPDKYSLPWCLHTDTYQNRIWSYCDKRICGVNNTVCGGELSASTGWLRVNSGERGDESWDCLWTLLAVGDAVIELQFYDFDLKFHYICGFEYVMIHEDSVIHGRFCGKKLPPVIRSMSQTLYVRFLSEESSTRKGFTATYVQVTPSGEATNGNRTRNNSYGLMTCPAEVNLLLYTGEVAVSNNGLPCINWVDTSEYRDWWLIYFDHTDGTVNAAKNYCRNIESSRPVCPVIDTTNRRRDYLEYCDKNICFFTDPDYQSTTTTTEALTTLPKDVVKKVVSKDSLTTMTTDGSINTESIVDTESTALSVGTPTVQETPSGRLNSYCRLVTCLCAILFTVSMTSSA